MIKLILNSLYSSKLNLYTVENKNNELVISDIKLVEYFGKIFIVFVLDISPLTKIILILISFNIIGESEFKLTVLIILIRLEIC
jgi:hypothetical protein